MKKHILITAFEPFGGASENRSIDTAEAIKRRLERVGFKVDICVLPVVFDLAAKRAKECYELSADKASTVISLGEGGCDIRMETAAHNRDSASGFPDNAGVIRKTAIIDPKGPAKIAFRSFVADMYCANPLKTREKITISESPGGFVCNNTAFHLGKFFTKNEVPYAFIHVPNSFCSQDNSLAVNAGNEISEMLMATFIAKSNNDVSIFENLCKELPISIDQLNNFQNIIKTYSKGKKKNCGNEFSKKLRERLELWEEKDSTF